METKHERPVRAETIDKRDQRRQDNPQKRPWALSQIGKFDKSERLHYRLTGA
jgi:hypothetical protein